MDLSVPYIIGFLKYSIFLLVHENIMYRFQKLGERDLRIQFCYPSENGVVCHVYALPRILTAVDNQRRCLLSRVTHRNQVIFPTAARFVQRGDRFLWSREWINRLKDVLLMLKFSLSTRNLWAPLRPPYPTSHGCACSHTCPKLWQWDLTAFIDEGSSKFAVFLVRLLETSQLYLQHHVAV